VGPGLEGRILEMDIKRIIEILISLALGFYVLGEEFYDSGAGFCAALTLVSVKSMFFYLI
jgi:hypothetical protein